MSKELVVSSTPHETRVAILEDGQLCEIYVEREKEYALVGSVYKGRVTRVLPGMQSAFVDIGLDTDAFLYVSDVFEDIEEYDHIVSAVEGKVQKMEQQGGEVFRPAVSSAASAATNESAASPEQEASSQPVPGPNGPNAGPAPEPPVSQPSFRHEHRGSEPHGHGRGRDRGGRFGRRGRDRDRRHGRELPPSKYVSPRPYEPESSEPREPVILPGESLAKYKDRMPRSSPETGSTAPLAGAEEDMKPMAASVAPADPATQPGPSEIIEERSSEPNGPVITGETAAPMLDEAIEELTSAQTAEPAAEAPAGAIYGEHDDPFDSTETRETPKHHTETVLGAQTELRPSPAFDSSSNASASPSPSEAPPVEAEEEKEPLEDWPSQGAMHSNNDLGQAELTGEEATALAEQLAEVVEEELEAAKTDAALAHSGEREPFAEGDETSSAAEMESEAALEGVEEEAEDAPAATAEETTSALETEALEIAGEVSEAATLEAGPGENEPRRARVEENTRARLQRPMRRGGRHRGRRVRPQGRASQPAPRRPQLISELLKPGQEITVQIAKEPLGKKGARITSHIALPGRFLVYMPTIDHMGVSRKIGSAETRSRLRRTVSELKGTNPGGFIVRTAAESATDEDIRNDVEFLTRTWADIRSRGEQRKAPALLHRDLNLVERILRDYLGPDYSAIWVDTEDEYTRVLDFVSRLQPQLVSRVKLYTKETPIFEEMGIQQDIDKSLRPKVWLKSGGYIVINHTEALVAIDVNTGKFVGRGSTRLEDTIVRTNIEAVKEIVRQIRLRDLGGIIVVDFIDMEERRNREKVLQALEEALRADRAPSKVLPFNEFGLVAITRKRTKQALERVLCQPCPYCTGSGMVKSVPTICYEIQAEARKMVTELDSQSLTLRVHPEIAKALKTRESGLIEELERTTHKNILIQADPTLHWEQYDIY